MKCKQWLCIDCRTKKNCLSVLLLKAPLKRDSLSPDTGGLKSLIIILNKSHPCTGLYETRSLRLLGFLDNRYTKMAMLSALRIGHFYPSGDISSNNISQRLSRPMGHRQTGRSKSMKNLNEPTVPQTREPRPTP